MEIVSMVVIMILVITVIGLGVCVLRLKRKLYYTEEHNMRLLKELLDRESNKKQEPNIWE